MSEVVVNVDVLRDLAWPRRSLPRAPRRPGQPRLPEDFPRFSSRADEVRISPAARRLADRASSERPLERTGDHEHSDRLAVKRRRPAIAREALGRANERSIAAESHIRPGDRVPVEIQPVREGTGHRLAGAVALADRNGHHEGNVTAPAGNGNVYENQRDNDSAHTNGPPPVTPRAFERANETSNARDALGSLVGRTPIVPPEADEPSDVSEEETGGSQTDPPSGSSSPVEESGEVTQSAGEDEPGESSGNPSAIPSQEVSDPPQLSQPDVPAGDSVGDAEATVPDGPNNPAPTADQEAAVASDGNVTDTPPEDTAPLQGASDSGADAPSATGDSTLGQTEVSPGASDQSSPEQAEPAADLSESGSQESPSAWISELPKPPQVVVSPSGSFIRLIDTTGWR